MADNGKRDINLCAQRNGIVSRIFRKYEPIRHRLFRQRGFCIDQMPAARHIKIMQIYKIFRANEWQNLQDEGQTLGAPIDLADGYVHFSTAAQAAETAEKYFSGIDGLMLLAVEADNCPEIKWEPSRGGALFPHLYRALRMADVIWAKPLPCAGSGHIFPAEMI